MNSPDKKISTSSGLVNIRYKMPAPAWISKNIKGTSTSKATSIRIPYLASFVIVLCFNYSTNIINKLDTKKCFGNFFAIILPRG